MAEKKKFRVCKRCLGFDVAELADKVSADDLSTGCISRCARKHPELAGKVYGFLAGEFVVCDTKEEFFAKIAEVE
ncbi:MAG: hypothetical protein HFE63_07875 [Clostridiales bacterium]|nr:hypothetical protein [Clostridiales bacterium]